MEAVCIRDVKCESGTQAITDIWLPVFTVIHLKKKIQHGKKARTF